MTIQIIFTILCCASSTFLLWCLNSFTRALRQGRRAVGLVVRVVDADAKGPATDNMRRNTGKVAIFPRRRPQLAQPEKAADVLRTMEAPRDTTEPELVPSSSSNIA